MLNNFMQAMGGVTGQLNCYQPPKIDILERLNADKKYHEEKLEKIDKALVLLHKNKDLKESITVLRDLGMI